MITNKVKAALWKMFLRIGHDLVWKADEWFQAQEVKIRKAPAEPDAEKENANYESIPGKHQPYGDREWIKSARVGRDHGEGSRFYRVGEPSTERRPTTAERSSGGSGDEAEEPGPFHAIRVGSDGVGNSHTARAGRVARSRHRLTAAGFDERLRIKLAKMHPVI